MLPSRLIQSIAAELSLAPRQVTGALELFEEGATLPFIARYRKEATGGLDEVQLRDVRGRAQYLGELEDRRATVLKTIDEQGRLDDALRGRIEAAGTKQELEDLYLPYRPKRRTRATMARERGLEPLADLLWAGEADDAAVERAAADFVDEAKGVASAEDALQGARDIVAERVSEDADLRGWVRDRTRERGVVASKVAPGREADAEAARFRDYFDHREPLTSIPSHRMLAVRRGEAEDVLSWTIEAPAEEILAGLQRRIVAPRAAKAHLGRAVEDAYRRLVAPSIEAELRLELKQHADGEAIAVFGRNLEQLLLQAPAGERAVIGLDPGFRTGVKVAVVSRTGAVLETGALYLHREQEFARELERLIEAHAPELIAIGNGTASRETEALVRSVVKRRGGSPQPVVVNEAGASVYSASDVARDELPELDVSLRGAVSIARRLQDPLAELVKIEPKSIGVGQYQHDVDQSQLKQRLDEGITVCVNRVGVEVNTASPSLLAYVAGIGPALAKNLVQLRDERGGLGSRRELLEVPRLGPRAFEQAAGFLRVRGGEHPLDATAVHPERYELVERMAADAGTDVAGLLRDDARLAGLEEELDRYIGDDVGLPTLRDILDELRRPGRDPRDAFETPSFREDVTDPKDLVPGMELEGVVTNVVAFGAFVDVGVHQDGLVHISKLADRFVRDPNEVVQVGQNVRVTVLGVDLERNRIALSMESKPDVGGRRQRGGDGDGGDRSRKRDGRGGRRRGRGRDRTPAKPKPGDIAPNGMRFT